MALSKISHQCWYVIKKRKLAKLNQIKSSCWGTIIYQINIDKSWESRLIGAPLISKMAASIVVRNLLGVFSHWYFLDSLQYVLKRLWPNETWRWNPVLLPFQKFILLKETEVKKIGIEYFQLEKISLTKQNRGQTDGAFSTWNSLR